MPTAVTLKHRSLHTDFVVEVDERIDEMLDNPDAMEQVRLLWQQSPVLVFRRQAIEEGEQVRFSEYFGRCEIIGRKDILSPYHDQIIYFSTLRYADGRFVGGFAGGDDVDWHSDQTFEQRPATGAMLYGVEVPKGGGDIYWANQYGAWDRLPDDVKALIDGKTGLYRYAKRLSIMNPLELKKNEAQAKAMSAKPDAFHPVVLAHPTTLVAIEGLSEAENARVLPMLFEAGGHESLVYRHKVRNGDLMLWDNGCTMHRRDQMQLDQPRLMKRTTFRLSGESYCVPQH